MGPTDLIELYWGNSHQNFRATGNQNLTLGKKTNSNLLKKVTIFRCFHSFLTKVHEVEQFSVLHKQVVQKADFQKIEIIRC